MAEGGHDAVRGHCTLFPLTAVLIDSGLVGTFPTPGAMLVNQMTSREKASQQAPTITPEQPEHKSINDASVQVIDSNGGGGQDRTADLRVMNPSL